MWTLVLVIVGLAALFVGAELAVAGARSFGLRVGLSPVIVGLTIVAYGTSAPELVVSTAATLEGADGIALANVVGSNICNILLILGVAALIRPMTTHARVLRVEAPLLVAISLLACGLLYFGGFGRAAGLVLLTGLVVYTVVTVRLARREPAEIEQEMAEAAPAPSRSPWLDLARAAAGLVLLVAGGAMLVRGATAGAAALGVPPAVVGLTVVAVGTSLPELATSVLAAVRGHADIAVGNVIGSNLFNILGVLGVAASVDPVSSAGVGWRDLGVMVACAVVLLVFLVTGRRLARGEGAVLLAGYGVYLWLTVP